MKEAITKKATELFLERGFKSVTMDDIANIMGISKKTIYSFFVNKTKLVEEATLFAYESICLGIDNILDQKLNPIEELFAVKDFVSQYLKGNASQSQFQLQKYYPEIYYHIISLQLGRMSKCVEENHHRGIEEALYRKDIDVDFITRIYFTGINGVKNADVFPTTEYNINVIEKKFIAYHIRSIATEKGLQKLKQFTNH